MNGDDGAGPGLEHLPGERPSGGEARRVGPTDVQLDPQPGGQRQPDVGQRPEPGLCLLPVQLHLDGLALVLVGGRLGAQRETVVRRYSTLAGVCFAVVALSGVVNAALRLGTFSALATTYGLLVVGKVIALGLLGVAGVLHRRRVIPRLGTERSAFARLAAVELIVMGATVGLAVALSRSAPPVPETAGEDDRIATLLGYPEPAPFTLGRYLTAFSPDLLWLVVAFGMLAFYVAGVVRMARRGDRWPHRVRLPPQARRRTVERPPARTSATRTSPTR